ncbi:Sec-independent protein translocase protein TatB [Propionivibrio sp.]|jgi:sec-independent protein translocase protein TatB|uniref:Sec-independent protein translocase protein TatB n=1 Tax=Propionivibrio sp. TaxID=2212460 RepID=UPI0039E3E245
MFDIGFSELIVIGIVALVVIGPERLPKVARTAGLLLGRLQRYVGDVKADISREMQLDELKKLQSEVQESARNFERSISSEVQAIEQGVGQTVDSIKADIKDAVPSPDAAPAAGEPAGEAPAEAPRQDASLPAAKG